VSWNRNLLRLVSKPIFRYPVQVESSVPLSPDIVAKFLLELQKEITNLETTLLICYSLVYIQLLNASGELMIYCIACLLPVLTDISRLHMSLLSAFLINDSYGYFTGTINI
jgi:hypothetical protein